MSITPIEARDLVASTPHWHHKFEIYPGVVTPGIFESVFLWDKLQIDERCAGKTILDIGASDGFYTRRMDMLGGNVTAVDFRRKEAHGFGVMEKLYGKEFRYQHCNVYDINVDEVGQSDLVLFFRCALPSTRYDQGFPQSQNALQIDSVAGNAFGQ